MFDDLTKLGLRIKPQIASSYRVDVVEAGQDGRRPAVECDGNRYH